MKTHTPPFRRALVALLAVATLAVPARAAQTRPNIILMLIDDMGVMDTSVPFLTDAAGQPKRYPLNDYFRTPNMERLASLFTGKRDTTRDEVFLMHYPHAPHRTDYFTTYRNADWRVIYHYFPSKVSEDSHYQLFNLATDPFEQKNLATAKPAHLHRLMQGLITALEKQSAVYPLDKENRTPLKPKLP